MVASNFTNYNEHFFGMNFKVRLTSIIAIMHTLNDTLIPNPKIISVISNKYWKWRIPTHWAEKPRFSLFTYFLWICFGNYSLFKLNIRRNWKLENIYCWDEYIDEWRIKIESPTNYILFTLAKKLKISRIHLNIISINQFFLSQ